MASSHLYCESVSITSELMTLSFLMKLATVIFSRNRNPLAGYLSLRPREGCAWGQSRDGHTKIPCGRDGAPKNLKAWPFFTHGYQVIKDSTHPQGSVTPNKLEEEEMEGRNKPVGFPGLSLPVLEDVCTEKHLLIPV